jgi:hypothetical protein
MKRLLQFLRDNNAKLEYNREYDSFEIVTKQGVYTAFVADLAIESNNPMRDFFEPAMLAIEREKKHGL